MDDKKYFTVEEANRLIPQIKAMIEQLRQGRHRLQKHRTTAEAIAQQAGGNGGGSEAGAYLSDYSQTFARGLAQLQAMGIVLKDLEQRPDRFSPPTRGPGGVSVLEVWRRAHRLLA